MKVRTHYGDELVQRPCPDVNPWFPTVRVNRTNQTKVAAAVAGGRTTDELCERRCARRLTQQGWTAARRTPHRLGGVPMAAAAYLWPPPAVPMAAAGHMIYQSSDLELLFSELTR